MGSFSGLVGTVSIVSALLGYGVAACAQEQSPATMQLHFKFDFETARMVSSAVSTGNFEAAAFADFCTTPDARALIKKMRLKGCDALLLHFKSFSKNKKAMAAASLISSELSKPDNGKYAPLAAEVSRQIKEYVPPELQANLNVHFIFGSYSGGFAFDDVPDDVYVNLARFSEATTQELAETVAHELFHAVQTHVMRPESLPTAAGQATRNGPIWVNHLLVNLQQEGTAELFTHPIADRPPTLYSTQRKLGIERNAKRIASLITMFETLGWRLLYVPPDDEDAYDRIYGLMFYTDFDETAYDLGWLMASTIAETDGKVAIFNLLKQEPKRFLLRYQAIALANGKLPTFSSEFIRKIETI
jgi:hypothetical protein